MTDFDNMTPKQVREWGENLAYDASQLGEVRATLIVNCKEGRPLRKLGITYDKNRNVISNLVIILKKLTLKAVMRTGND